MLNKHTENQQYPDGGTSKCIMCGHKPTRATIQTHSTSPVPSRSLLHAENLVL